MYYDRGIIGTLDEHRANPVRIYACTLNECKPLAPHEFSDHGIINFV